MDGSRAMAEGLSAHESDDATTEHGPVVTQDEREPRLNRTT